MDAPFGLFPVTILKPLKGADSDLKQNLETFFNLDYPKFELLFSVADPFDPAFDVACELIRKHPHVRARLITGDVKVGANPKINNMVKSYGQAAYDWLLISDSNVRVKPDYLKRMVAHLETGVGAVTSVVAGQNPEQLGGHLEASYLNTFYARGMMLAFRTGNPIVMGKSMLFRKSTAERFGGITMLARYLAEDYMAGEAIRHLGLRALMTCDPIVQHIGNYSFKSFWQRHLRWGRIRKNQSPITFWIEPLLGCFPSALIGAIAAHMAFGFSIADFLALHLVVWSSCDFLMMRRLGQKIEYKLPLIWFLREALVLPLWINIAAGNTVDWRGGKLKLNTNGILEA